MPEIKKDSDITMTQKIPVHSTEIRKDSGTITNQKNPATRSVIPDTTNSLALNDTSRTKQKEADNFTDTKKTITSKSDTPNNIPVNGNKTEPGKNKNTLQPQPSREKMTTVGPIQSKDPSTVKNVEKQKPANLPVASPSQNLIRDSIKTPENLPLTVTARTNEAIQDIYFKNDSLVLALYDNGIIDGDTVSVFLNGAPVISKQMLKAVAIKKTVYISAATDSVQLILFAENLGTIPPNTGLLIIHDGDNSYQVHFSADLQRNASITLKRKKG